MDEQRLSAGGNLMRQNLSLETCLRKYKKAQRDFDEARRVVMEAEVREAHTLSDLREAADDVERSMDAGQFLALLREDPLLCQDFPSRHKTERRWLAHIEYPFETTGEVFQDAENQGILLKRCTFCEPKRDDVQCVLAYGASNEMRGFLSPPMLDSVRIKEVKDDSLEREFRLKFNEEDDYDDDLGID